MFLYHTSNDIYVEQMLTPTTENLKKTLEKNLSLYIMKLDEANQRKNGDTSDETE